MRKMIVLLSLLHSFVLLAADYPKPQFSGKKTPSDFSKLPKALMNKKEPIDPFCVLKAMTEKPENGQAFAECAGNATTVLRYTMLTSHVEEGTIGADVERYDDEGDKETCDVRVEVQGTVEQKALVRLRHWCGYGHRQEMLLGLVEQKNNKLFSVGNLVGGEGCDFGRASTDSIKNGIYRFNLSATAEKFFDAIYRKVNKKPPEEILNLGHLCMGTLKLEIDLKKFPKESKFDLLEVRYDPYARIGDETFARNCVSNAIKKHMKEHELPAPKFPAFVEDIDACINSRIKKNMVKSPDNSIKI